jgi:hypothetical protein
MTYDRILKEIKKRLTQRVFQCLVVAVRPLRVEDLAEVLAVDFDDAEGISIAEDGGSRVVQFSHLRNS